MAGVLVLIEEHHLIAGPFGRADLGMAVRDPGGQHHLIPVVDYLAGLLRRRVGRHDRQQLLPRALAGQGLPHRGGHLSWKRRCMCSQPLADLPDLTGGAQVLGQFAGQRQHSRGGPCWCPGHRVHGPAIGGDHPRRDLPGDRRGDQAQRGFKRLAQCVVGDEPRGVGVVGRDGRLAVEHAVGISRAQTWLAQTWLAQTWLAQTWLAQPRPTQAVQPGPHPLVEFGGRLPGEGEAEHPFRPDHAVRNQPDQPGRHGFALARARARDHRQRLRRR